MAYFECAASLWLLRLAHMHYHYQIWKQGTYDTWGVRCVCMVCS